MKCIIVEDQPPAQRILKRYIDEVGILTLVATFSNPLEAMEFLKKEKIDLMFLDIHLPKISGIELLKSMPVAPKVILTTAFPEFALESYELSVVDYLLKPFSFARFVMAIGKVSESMPEKEETISQNTESYFFVKVGYDLIKLRTEHITYIKSDRDYTEVFVEGNRFITQETLKQWQEKLGNQNFVRIHKSYLINTAFIFKIASGQVELKDNSKLPIGRAYKEDFELKVLGRS